MSEGINVNHKYAVETEFYAQHKYFTDVKFFKSKKKADAYAKQEERSSDTIIVRKFKIDYKRVK